MADDALYRVKQDRRKSRGSFHWMKGSVLWAVTVWQTPLALLLCWGGAALTMPNTPGTIKTESAPAFFRMYCADLKWLFYIYRLNRRCVLLGQPYYAVAKQPEPHVLRAHVQCHAQASDLALKAPAQLLAHSSAPKSWLGCRGHASPHKVPSGSATNHTNPCTQPGHLSADLPHPQCPTGSSGALGVPKPLDGPICCECRGCHK